MIMTYQEANNISIKDYLDSLGILPVVDKLYYGMYHSPFRQDDTPSLKVDYGVNLWCDFGTGEGGSLIDLVMKQHSCNAYGAISRLEQGYYSILISYFIDLNYLLTTVQRNFLRHDLN